jgi:hypothetical protein
MKRPTVIFLSSLFGPPTPLRSTMHHSQSGSQSLFSLTLFSLCVAGRACLSQLTEGGGGGRAGRTKVRKTKL